MAYLYALCDEQGFVRYVGSSSNPWARYSNHVSQFAALAVREWVAGLHAMGAKPLLCILGEVEESRRFEAEANLIRCIQQNATLLNCGGAKQKKEGRRSGTSAGALALLAVMKRRHLSQVGVAATVGTDPPTISRLVRGHRGPSRSLALALRDSFGVDPALWDLPSDSISAAETEKVAS